MRAEEEGWRAGRRRNEATRRLHRFVGEVGAGAQEWGGVAKGEEGEGELVSGTWLGRMRGVCVLTLKLLLTVQPLRMRLQGISRALGVGAGRDGVLASRVERLNAELRRLHS